MRKVIICHTITIETVVYTGTHDNDTIKGWFQSISLEDRQFALRYLNRSEEVHRIVSDMICLAMQSVADLCIIPIQDYLELGSEARINVPSTVGQNWKWRLLEDDISEDLLIKIHTLTKTYGRCY